MALALSLRQNMLKIFAIGVILLNTSMLSQAASDSARVISSHAGKHAGKQSTLSKVSAEKLSVVALINLEEVMPDCQQQVARTKIKSVQRSESGMTTESITFSWSNATITIPTYMGDNPVLTLDDLIAATKFIQVGNTYFIHFQTCNHTQEKSLINIYAI